MSAYAPAADPTLPRRLTSIDAYRGFVMFLLLAEVFQFGALAKAHPESPVWSFLAYHQSHVEWVGCSLHDLIQPSFSFLVGAALPFSIASRRARGQSLGRMTAHAAWRALALVFLGIFLRSMGQSQTNYTFEDTLTQIGLGYLFLFWIGLRPVRDQWLALAVILVGYWGAFALYTPGTGHDPAAYGVPKDWPHLASGFAAHWNKNANLAWAFDQWFLNLFPRKSPFTHNGGGYATLSFIPTLGTMVLGLIGGEVLKDDRRTPAAKVAWLVAAGVVGLAAGWGLGELGVCPVVKRIWTPSWVLFSGGWCFLLLAGCYAVIDALGLRAWAFPLVVIGMNSIAAYLLHWTVSGSRGFIRGNLITHLGRDVFQALGPEYEPAVMGGAIVLVTWVVLYWMYRRGIFLRV